MRRLLQSIIFGVALLASPIQVIPQDTDISIEIKPGITRQEAENKINFLKFSISRLSSTKNKTQQYEEIKNNLLKLFEYSNDREIQYYANFLMARLTFERGSGALYDISIGGKVVQDHKAFLETFSSLEKCIFEYSEKEKEFGLAAEALSKISDKFSKERKLIGTSRCYELYNLSSYPQNNSRILKKNLDNILDTEIGGLHLKEALDKIFFPDEVEAFANLRRYDRIHGGDRKVYIAPLPENYARAWSKPKTELEEIRISSETGIFPEMRIKNVNLAEKNGESDSLFYYYRREIKLTPNIIREHGERNLIRNGIFIFNDMKSGFIYPIVVKKGVKIRDILEKGGINPYNWIYKDIKSSEGKSLKNMDW